MQCSDNGLYSSFGLMLNYMELLSLLSILSLTIMTDLIYFELLVSHLMYYFLLLLENAITN